MREIKFRAWHKELKEMFFDVSINSVAWLDRSSHYGGDNSTAMQFTNLKDRNGNEIYDRTILRFLINGKKYNEELYEVSYSEERACWQINCIKKCNHMDSPVYIARHLTQTLAECFEVAGNVFENSELFED